MKNKIKWLLEKIEKKLLKMDTKELAIEVHGPEDIAITISPFLSGKDEDSKRHPSNNWKYYLVKKKFLNIFEENEGMSCYITSMNENPFHDKNIEVQINHNLVGKRLNLSNSFPDNIEVKIFEIRRINNKMIIKYEDHFIQALEIENKDSVSSKSFSEMMSNLKKTK